MKNKRIKKVFKMLGACFLIGAVSLSGLVGCAPSSQGMLKEINPTIAEDVLVPDFQVVPSNSAELKLFSSEPTVVNNENSVYIERKITATVYPVDTPYQEVTWELSWVDASEEEVSDYVTITPSESDSRILTLRCYKAFLNKDMQLVCRTVVGNYTATASVTYYGAPTTFSMQNKPTNISDEISNVEYRKLIAGNEYNCIIVLSNKLGCVNPDFEPSFTLRATTYGSVNLTNGEILEFKSISTREDGKYLEFYLFSPNDDTPVSECLLTIEVKDSCELILIAEQSVESFVKDDVAFESNVDVSCYLQLRIIEHVTGMYKTYNFKVFSE